ncbi:tRNA lysidine(34) synthetase TilS [Ureaplasma diversum]|uniref:tRNA(Ile)-lysidine synthase n=1 Tax=Ureaplasma diversum NCTC 246 TaxID=1188241 RepID=A0A084F1A9_9BACT|nr:tRNA lysidine(34) synthetase TilS [Ureaplasma diversum]KEZ24001.1 tRNA(Ile)-lysidine synthase [Ureaplasma diversum NCTC 246]
MKNWWTNITNLFSSKKVVAAVSGGPDSMAMLDLYKKHIKVVCHINYNKRADSFKDSEVVKAFCHKHNIALEILNVDQSVYEKYDQIKNFQAQARAIRYDFFKEIAIKYNLKTLYVAHNLDDWVETAYMQKARSSKALYYGIRDTTVINQLIIKRPVINYRKSTLLRHCQTNNIPFVIDETNEMDIYERNTVRKTIATWSSQQFEDFYKQIKKYNKANKWLDENVQIAWIDFLKAKFDYSYFHLQSDAIQYHLIFRMLNHFEIKRVSEAKINAILDFLRNKNSNSRKYRVQEDFFMTVNANNKIIIDQFKKSDDFIDDEIL